MALCDCADLEMFSRLTAAWKRIVQHIGRKVHTLGNIQPGQNFQQSAHFPIAFRPLYYISIAQSVATER